MGVCLLCFRDGRAFGDIKNWVSLFGHPSVNGYGKTDWGASLATMKNAKNYNRPKKHEKNRVLPRKGTEYGHIESGAGQKNVKYTGWVFCAAQ